MRWSLLHRGDTESAPVDDTIYTLNLSDSDAADRSRLQMLSYDQLRVVREFLKFMAARPNEADAQVAQEALERVERRLEGSDFHE
jgi:hypothetical protein